MKNVLLDILCVIAEVLVSTTMVLLFPLCILEWLVAVKIKRFRQNLNKLRHRINDELADYEKLKDVSLIRFLLRVYSFVLNLIWKVFVQEGGA